MFNKDSHSKRSLVLPIALIAILLAQPALSGRNNRKQSSRGSVPKSSGSSQRSNAQKTSRPSNRHIPSRQAPGLSRNIPQGSNRMNESHVNRYRTSRQNRLTNRNSANILSGSRSTSNMLTRQSASQLSSLRVPGLGNRTSRKSNSILSDPITTSSLDRSFRKQSTYDYPPSHRSYYSYHRDYYPHSRIFYWVTWPECYHPICYTWGPDYSVGYFWPYYHRKYVFVSLGGYWPCYTYRRYYWYGCHPYTWYGYYPPGYVVTGNTYNYYYYNTDPPPPDAMSKAQGKLDENSMVQPAKESQADRNFDQAVKAFESGDYTSAANKFYEAQVFAPDDIVLPFAYVQALFADGQYKLAGQILRGALAKQASDKEGVFYPRGLYPDEIVLQQQIEQLKRTVILNELDADSELLLGYQLLGIGRYDEAARHLQIAALNSDNNKAATMLINLLEKLKEADNQQAQEPDNPQSDGTEIKSAEQENNINIP